MNAWSAEVCVTVGAFGLDVALQGDAGVTALIGPNGSGKTTLLRAIAGAIPPTRAEVQVGGRVLMSTKDGLAVPIERRRVGYVPQSYGLFEHLSVRENVAFGLTVGAQALSRDQAAERAHEELRRLGCAALSERGVRGLSGGERQRVALARALVTRPELMLLDEPMAALDAVTRRSVRETLASRLREFGRPAVLVTHDVRDVEALGASVCVLEAGHVTRRASLEELRADPGSAFLTEFLGAT